MSDKDVYEAPKSELQEVEDHGEYGSIEKGLAGDYELSIGAILNEAWAATSGNKLLLNSAAALYFLVILAYAVLVSSVVWIFGGTDPTGAGTRLITLPVDIIYYGLTGVITAGLYVMAAKISMGIPTRSGEVFRFLNRFVKGLLTYLLMMIMVALGLLLLVIPGIYLAVAYLPAVTLAVEKNLSPWEALEISRKTVSKNWFSVFGLFLVCGLIMSLSIFTLGIAMIWFFPLIMLAFGIMYRNMFGLSLETLAS